jgi:hypothetical protein
LQVQCSKISVSHSHSESLSFLRTLRDKGLPRKPNPYQLTAITSN